MSGRAWVWCTVCDWRAWSRFPDYRCPCPEPSCPGEVVRYGEEEL